MILVTGGTGFLGSHLLRALVAAGRPVRALYRTTPPASLKDIASHITWVKCDILDVCALEEAMQGVTAVYHCAAVVAFDPASQKTMKHVNTEGTANVVNMALDAGVRKMLHVSSVAAIGRAKAGKMIDEDCEWEESGHNSGYAVSKFEAEMEAWRGQAEGLDTVIVNPSIILGPGYWNEFSGSMVRHAWKEFPYYTSGVNGFVDVYDVVKAMIQLMESDISGERFILCAENWSYQQLFTTMAHALGKKPPHIAARPWMAALMWRIEKLRSLFTGKRPLITRETAHTALLKVYYDNSKIQEYLPGFRFNALEDSIGRICSAYVKERQV